MADGEGFNAYEYQREEAEIHEAEFQRDLDEMDTPEDSTVNRAWLEECRRASRNESMPEDLRQQAERLRRYLAWETRRAALVAAGQAKMVAMREALRA